MTSDLWLCRWGGQGSNLRPEDYESPPRLPAERPRCLHWASDLLLRTRSHSHRFVPFRTLPRTFDGHVGGEEQVPDAPGLANVA